MEISNGKATIACSAKEKEMYATSMITGTAKLEQRNSNGTYKTVKTWDDLESKGSTLSVNKTYYVSTGYTNRLTFTAKVTRSESTETVSISISTTAKS